MRIILMLFLLISSTSLSQGQVGKSASFSLQIGDVVIPYSVFGMFVLPNEESEVEIIFENEQQNYYLLSEAGVLEKSGDNAYGKLRPSKATMGFSL